MSEPRWHDADPRPPYGGVPGPEIRSARNAPESPAAGGRLRGSDRPAAWEGPGWYREDSDPFRSVEMSAGPHRAADEDGRAGRRADDGGAGRRVDRRADRPPGRSWRWGRLSGGRGALILVAAALLGAIITVAAKREPGAPLGWLIVAGTLIAGLAVRPRAAYLLVPWPALAYVVFGLAAGVIHNQSNPSGSGLAVGAAQWIANGFLTMAVATVLAVVIALGRWLLDRRASASPAGRRRAEAGAATRTGTGGAGRRRGGRLDEGDEDRGVRSDLSSSGLIDQSDEVGFGGQRGRRGRGDASDWPGRSDQAGRSDQVGRSGWSGQRGRSERPGWSDGAGRSERSGRGGREEAPGRPKPAFYPNPDWPGDRGPGRDPRDRRPPPGPPSFGASRDLAC
jgi:hypothetical protein